MLLKGKFMNSKSGDNMRKVLVVVQYTASMILLCSTLHRLRTIKFHAQAAFGE